MMKFVTGSPISKQSDVTGSGPIKYDDPNSPNNNVITMNVGDVCQDHKTG